jgi:hypothetical protein
MGRKKIMKKLNNLLIEYLSSVNLAGRIVFVVVAIAFILAFSISALAGEKILHSKIKNIEPHEVGGQYCFVKVIIKQKDDEIIKEEVLECADGKKGPETPGYWELFAEFYYHDVSAPEYCRYYSRPKHVFKTPGKTCLQLNGEWEIR